MDWTRRKVLYAGAGISASMAGCLGDHDDGETAGNDETPFETEPEALLLAKERLQETLEGEWITEEPEDESMVRSADEAVMYIPFNEETGEFHTESGFVTNGVWLFEDIETAREEYDGLRYHEGWGYEGKGIAVESIGGKVDSHNYSRVLFRDANALGGIQYRNDSVEDGTIEQRAVELASLMHESWRDG